MRSLLPTSLFLLFVVVLGGSSCDETWTVPRRDHCAQRSGDQWCAEVYADGSRRFCRRGYCDDEAGEQDPIARDGCVAQRPVEDACYSPCGYGTTVLEESSCLARKDPTDGNGEPASAGSSTTDAESSTGNPEPECGNGLVEDGETCDDGDDNGQPGACAIDCLGHPTWCGDGLTQDGESCDDANAVNGDGCNVDCRPSGMVVWERELAFEGRAYGASVGLDGGLYIAGQVTGGPTAAWAARLAAQDGVIDWTKTVATPPGSLDTNTFFASRVIDARTVAFAGRHSDHAYLLELDAAGSVLGAFSDPTVPELTNLAILSDGYLAKSGGTAVRYDAVLEPQWTGFFGDGLAYQAGDDVALLAVGVGFRRITLDGAALSPVVFPLPDVLAQTQLVAWSASGDVVVAGYVASGGGTNALVLKATPGGTLRWVHGMEEVESQDRQIFCLAVDGHDGIVVGGQGWILGSTRPFLMKLDRVGAVLWVRQLELEADDAVVRGCAATATDEVVAVGDAGGHIWAVMLTP